jgi:DNA (cytosine-5)-methyltransferase 1
VSKAFPAFLAFVWTIRSMAARGRRKPTFIGLFCGCGGFDLGFEQAGFRSLAALDIDPHAIATYNENLAGRAAHCDLSQRDSLQRASHADVVIAGPPCQGFSTLGRRLSTDPRNSLLLRAAQLAVRSDPKVIVLENVSGAIAGAQRSIWAAARELIERAGFNTREFQILGTAFGLPQIRKRVILLAARYNLEHISVPSPEGNVALRPFLSNVEGLPNHAPRRLTPGTLAFRVAEQIRQHQKLCNVRGGLRSVPTWDIPEVFGSVTIRERNLLCLIRALRRRQRRRGCGDSDPLSLHDLADFCDFDPAPALGRLRAKGYVRTIGRRYDLTHTFNGKFRRLSFDHPAPAVDTRFGQPRYFLHPAEHRGLSAREAARIQGFPDEFRFKGSVSTQFRLIGNAVSPAIGRWFAQLIRDRLL